MNHLPEHVRRNRAHWDQLAANFVSAGEHSWITNEPNWGIWSMPKSEVRMFPDELADKDVIELGCSTRYPFVTLEWARQWPSEEAWKARKR